MKPAQYAKNRGLVGTDDDPELQGQLAECTGRPEINAFGAHLVNAEDRELNTIWGVETMKKRLEEGYKKEILKKFVHERNPTGGVTNQLKKGKQVE